MNLELKKQQGIFFTESHIIAEKLLSNLEFDKNFLNKKVLEPSVGEGHLIIKLIEKLKENNFKYEEIIFFLKNNLFINDINKIFVDKTILNINNYLTKNFNHKEKIIPNFSVLDFSKKINNRSLLNEESFYKKYINKFDIVFGNPPFVTLYGRRDKKVNENQRVEYLNTFDQFPAYLKNGKINILMLFIENGLDLLKSDGNLLYICDGTFFERSFKYTRKFLLENYFIKKLYINLKEFEEVYSSQVILNVKKRNYKKEDLTYVIDDKLNKTLKINQSIWINESDDYKIRFYFDSKISEILLKIRKEVSNTLYQSYPKKNLRTSSMLLTYEDDFTTNDINKKKENYYNFYHGSKSLKEKYGELYYNKLFFYDKEKQDRINDNLKEELIKRGIKNKKRIGLGEKIVHNLPKIYLRQSCKDIIATIDMEKSTANNSLYLFTLRSKELKDLEVLKYLCGLLNSKLINFYCKAFEIIRTGIAKQPQINISDLYKIPFPLNSILQKKISLLVDQIYKDKSKKELCMEKIDELIFSYFKINNNDINFINDYLNNY